MPGNHAISAPFANSLHPPVSSPSADRQATAISTAVMPKTVWSENITILRDDAVFFEGPGANLPIIAPESDPDDDDPPAPDDSPMTDVSDEEKEWRILCASHTYQGRPRYNTLLVGAS